MPPECHICGNTYSPAREALGYNTCLTCGEASAQAMAHARRKSFVLQHKQAYMYVSDKAALREMNSGKILA